MPLTCWNTAKALFWIILRQSPTDRLLDQDDELALATVLLSAQPFAPAKRSGDEIAL
jgi:hypothetical protein